MPHVRDAHESHRRAAFRLLDKIHSGVNGHYSRVTHAFDVPPELSARLKTVENRQSKSVYSFDSTNSIPRAKTHVLLPLQQLLMLHSDVRPWPEANDY